MADSCAWCHHVIPGKPSTPGDAADRLSRISTHWDLLFEMHKETTQATEARRELLQRYCGAVFRYLVAAVHKVDDAEDLSQEFALRVIRGDFRNADPGKGRFRDFLKTTLYHMVVDYHRRQRNAHRPLPGNSSLMFADDAPSKFDDEFIEHWRAELLDRAWDALLELQVNGATPWHALLAWRVSHPQANSAELARECTQRIGRTISDTTARQILHRARVKFADCLLTEVSRSLESHDPRQIEAEVIELGLLPYCRSVLQQRMQRGNASSE